MSIKKFDFLINSKINKKIYINNIYASISINNIENYLKSIENVQESYNTNIDIIIIPNTLVYSIDHLLWGLFIAKNKFEEKINISKDLFKEVLLVLSCSDQLNKINKKYYLKKGKQDVFVLIISKSKISKKEIKNILKKLDIKEKDFKNLKFNKNKLLKYYNIKKDEKNIENRIIEKMVVI